MPDNFRNPPNDELPCSESYPNPPNPATPSLSLREKIVSEIEHRGDLAFPDYLNIALYEPNQGYYARGNTQVGRGGDFYTSVSVGPLFGRLIARRFANWWEENGAPEAWRIVEIGAHDGKLAADILSCLRENFPDAWKSLEYAISEPQQLLREAQHERLSNLAVNLNIASSMSQIATKSLPGIAFGNEILDALPFHLVEMDSGKWQELHVSNNFTFTNKDIEVGSPLALALDKIGTDFPQGYRTEIRTNFQSFLNELSACIQSGLLLFIDYGFAEPEYYERTRAAGTLRTFSKHKAGEDPLERPGEIDITAHVDFTDLATVANTIGYSPTAFSNQGSYLTHLAAPLMLTGEFGDSKVIDQFRALTHPGNLGGSFHVIELSSGGKTPETVAHRLAITL
ncbi:MAG: class I SAM-dependent methyltransferase [Luteolibacter sp.]